MSKISNLLAALVFVSLVVFISCGKDDGGGGSNPLADQAALLQNSWSIDVSSSTLIDGDWTGFTLDITGASAAGGSFSANTPSDFTSVWPTGGTWAFEDDDPSFMLRSDGITMEVTSVSATSLTLDFNIPEDAVRTSGISGDWTFVFTAAN